MNTSQMMWLVALFSLSLLLLAVTGTRDTILSQITDQIKTLEQFIRSKPNADAYRKLGLLYQSRDAHFHAGGVDKPKALDAFNQALEWDDGNTASLMIQVNHHKGMLLKMMNRGKESLDALEQGLQYAETNHDQAGLLHSMADSLVFMANVDKAIDVYKETLHLAPYNLESYLPLTNCYKEKNMLSKQEWLEFLEEMENVVDQWNQGDFDRPELRDDIRRSSLTTSSVTILSGEITTSAIYWAMFTAAEKASKLDLAWEYLEEAHRIEMVVKGSSFDGKSLIQQTRNIKSIFHPEFWPPGVGDDSHAPVFIVGMMRSGSTLLETMLDAHHQVWGLGEDSIFNSALPAFRDDLVQATATGDVVAVQNVVRTHAANIIKKMKQTAKTEGKNDDNHHQLKRLVDKQLFNYRNIGFIRLMFPKAVILHTMRDPMDTLFSCYKHKFDDGGLEWALDAEQLALQYAQYLEIMHHFHTVLPGYVMDIRYEEVVADNEGIMRQVITKLGLKWDPTILQFHASNRSIQTHSMQQVRQGIYSASIGSWRKYVKHLGPLLRAIQKYLPGLRAKGALRYEDSVNWDCDPNFDYNITVMTPAPAHAPAEQELSTKQKKSNKRRNQGTDEDAQDAHDEETKNKNVINAEVGMDGSVSTSSRSANQRKVRRQTDNRAEREVEEEDEEEDTYRQRNREVRRRRRYQNGDRSDAARRRQWRQQRGQRVRRRQRQRRPRRVSVEYDDDEEENGNQEDEQEVEEDDDDEEVEEAIREPVPTKPSSPTTTHARSKRTTNDAGNKLVAKSVQDSIAKLHERTKDPEALIPGMMHGSQWQQLLSNMFLSWNHRSVDPRLDQAVAIAYICIHYQLHPLAAGILNDVRNIYELAGIVTHSGSRRVGSGSSYLSLLAPDSVILPPIKSRGEVNNIDSSSPAHDDSGNNQSPLCRVFLGQGSALALSGRLPEALEVFEDMLLWQPQHIEGLIKKAEVQNAVEDYAGAVETYTEVFDMGRDTVGLRFARGGSYFKLRKYFLAMNDFEIAQKLNNRKGQWGVDLGKSKEEVDGMILHRMGKCYKEFGEANKSIEVLTKVLNRPQYIAEGYEKDMLMDIAAVLMEVGRYDEALPYVEKSLQLEPRYRYALGYRGLLMHTLGRPTSALRDLNAAVAIDNNDPVVFVLRAVCMQCLDRNQEAAAILDELLSLYPVHHAWYRRELTYFYQIIAHRSLRTFNYDDKLHLEIKTGMSQPEHFTIPPPSKYTSYKNQAVSAVNAARKKKLHLISDEDKHRIDGFVRATSYLSRLIQLDTPGFLPNIRQHRQFGLAVLHMAQTLREHTMARYQGGQGLAVADGMSSKIGYFGWQTFDSTNPASDKEKQGGSVSEGYHVFGWRDLFDIAVRWRQYCEPMDVVYWLDRLDLPDDQSSRVGLNTYMVAGSKKITRYYAYNDWAFEITQKHMQETGILNSREEFYVLPSAHKELARTARTHEDLFKAAGNIPFVQVLPCGSIARPGSFLNGTRLHLGIGKEEGFDFSICSASTAARTLQFHEEHHAAFGRLEKALLHHHTLIIEKQNDEESIATAKNAVIRCGLEIFYYWVNFAPITRGTSATGYAVLYSTILAVGEEITDRIPHMKQLDWEAMFTPQPDVFVERVLQWIAHRQPANLPVDMLTTHLHPHMDTIECVRFLREHNQSHANLDRLDRPIVCPRNDARVADMFDTMTNIVTAMNAFGEISSNDLGNRK